MTEENIRTAFENKIFYRNNLTFGETHRKVMENKGQIWYGASTAWWTDDPEDIGKLEPSERLAFAGGLPCDSRNGVLFQTAENDGITFLNKAKQKPDRYGKFGLDTFMAMHHKNSFKLLRPYKHWASVVVQDYEDALDWGREDIPADLWRAVELLMRIMAKDMPEKDFYDMIELSEDSFMAKAHHSLGQGIRNDWDLWGAKAENNKTEPTAIRSWMVERGVLHGDNLSSVILRVMHRIYTDKEVQLDKLLEEYKG